MSIRYTGSSTDAEDGSEAGGYAKSHLSGNGGLGRDPAIPDNFSDPGPVWAPSASRELLADVEDDGESSASGTVAVGRSTRWVPPRTVRAFEHAAQEGMTVDRHCSSTGIVYTSIRPQQSRSHPRGVPSLRDDLKRRRKATAKAKLPLFDPPVPQASDRMTASELRSLGEVLHYARKHGVSREELENVLKFAEAQGFPAQTLLRGLKAADQRDIRDAIDEAKQRKKKARRSTISAALGFHKRSPPVAATPPRKGKAPVAPIPPRRATGPAVPTRDKDTNTRRAGAYPNAMSRI